MRKDYPAAVGNIGRVKMATDRRVNPSFRELSDDGHQNILTLGNCHEYTTVTADLVQDKCVLSF